MDFYLISHTYQIPIVEILVSSGIEMTFIYVTGLQQVSQVCQQETVLNYLRQKGLAQRVVYLSLSEVGRRTHPHPGSSVALNQTRAISFGHGIDEEEVIIGLSQGQPIRSEISHLLDFHRKVVDRERQEDLFREIYQLDRTKPILIFSDGLNIPLLKIYGEEYEAQVADQLLDQLIQLKEKYQVVLRFHPFQEMGFKMSQQYPTKLLENFMVSFTPFNSFLLYQMAEAIVTTRYTSSGFQSLFSGLEKVVLIDFDLDQRKKNSQLLPGYFQQFSNADFQQWQEEGSIVSKQMVTVLPERELDQLASTILEDRLVFDLDRLDRLFRQRYGQTRREILASQRSAEQIVAEMVPSR